MFHSITRIFVFVYVVCVVKIYVGTYYCEQYNKYSVCCVYCYVLASDISPEDPRWIGSWWLGYIICSTVLVVLSIPMWFIPKSLIKQDIKECDVKKHISKIAKFNNEVKGDRFLGCIIFTVEYSI